MAEFKFEICKACSYKHHVSEPRENNPCPRCGKPMQFSDNWYMGITVNGKHIIRAVSKDRKKAHLAYASLKKSVIENRFFHIAPSTPWATAVKEFTKFSWVTKRGPLSEKTKGMYLNSLSALAEQFSTTTLDKITLKVVENYREWRKANPRKGYGHETVKNECSLATVNRDMATLKRLLTKSIEWGLLEWSTETDKVLKMQIPGEVSRIRYLTDQEIDALLSQCNTPQLHLAVLIALHTGLRADGVKRMKRSDIDLQRNVIIRTTKGGKTVQIPISPTLRQALLEYPVMGEWLFPSIDVHGRRINNGPINAEADMGFNNACKRAEISDFHFHDLRHTFATHFLARTSDPKALQELLGHSSINTTMKYAHIMDGHLQRRMEEFDRGVAHERD